MSKLVIRQIIREMLLNEADPGLAIPPVNSLYTFGAESSVYDAAKTAAAILASTQAAGFVRKAYGGVKSRATKLGGAIRKNPRKAAGVLGVLGALYLLFNVDDSKSETKEEIEDKAKLESDVTKEIDEKLQSVSNVAVVDEDSAKKDIKDSTYEDTLDKAKSDFIKNINTYSSIMREYYPSVSWSDKITAEMQLDSGVIHLLAALQVNDYITGAIFAQYSVAVKNDKYNPVYKYAQKMISEIERTPIIVAAHALEDELKKVT